METNHGNENIGIPGISSIKIRLSIARRNHYLDFHCTLTVIMPELMAQALCFIKSF